MNTQPQPNIEQKLYEYAVILFREGGSLASVRSNLMEYGVDQQTADQIIARAKDRPPELIVKKKLPRDVQIRERKKVARNEILAGIGLGAFDGILRIFLGASPNSAVAIIVFILVLVSSVLFLIGVYHWATAAGFAP